MSYSHGFSSAFASNAVKNDASSHAPVCENASSGASDFHSKLAGHVESRNDCV